MKISCPNCSAAYELDDARVPPAGLSIKCPKCKSPFTVHRPKAGEPAAKGVTKGAVPLPGQPGSRPPPAAAKPAAAAKRPGGAIPLPGTGDAAASLPEVPGAVPLPGLDGGLPGPDLQKTATDFRPPTGRRGATAGAVPLPGLDENTPPPSTGRRAAPGGAKAPPPDLDLAFPPDAPPPQSPKVAAAPPGDDFALEMAVEASTAVVPKPGQEEKKGKKAATPVTIPEPGLNFDFVDPPKPSAPPPASGPDMLDFVDEKPADKAGDKARRPTPPTIAPGATAASQAVDEALFDTGGGQAAKPAEKKAAKERQKAERAAEKERERSERARRKRSREPGAVSGFFKSPKAIGGTLVLLALAASAVMGFRARKTPDGLFWMNRLVPAKRQASATETKVIDTGMQKLQQGDFAGAREALASAARLLTVLPDDEEVKAFFVLCASELRLDYGQGGADWDQAKRVNEKMKSARPAQARARGALALAEGDWAKAKQQLAALGDAQSADVESTWLYAEALRLSGEGSRAEQILDNALKTRAAGSAKLLLLRGRVSRARGQLADAAGFFEKALEASPQNGRVLIELADVRVRRGELPKASALLDKALDTDVRKSLDAVEEGRANMLKGKIAAASHQPKEAEAAFERAVTLDAGSAEIREAYGNFYLSRREWEKASRQFDASIGAGNATGAVLAGAARAYLGTNRLLEADKRINEAVAKDPNPHVTFVQGRVAEAIGKQEEALKAYQSALSKKPDSVEALCASGVIHAARGDRVKAAAQLEAALKVADENRTALEEEAVGELALALGEVKQARDAYQRALKKDSDDAMAHAGYGQTLAALGDLRAARKEMEIAVAQIDSDASIQYEYGSLLRRMGEPEPALAALQKAVKLDSKDPRYRARLGAILVEARQFDEAEKQLRQAVLMNDRLGEAQFFLGRALAGRRNLNDAVDVLKKAVELEPENADYHYHLGLTYYAGMRVQDAVESFARGLEHNPKNVDALEHLGLSLVIENRFGEAVAAFRKAVELEPKRARLWAEVGDAEQQAGDVNGAIRDYQRALAMDPNLTGVWGKLGVAYKDLDCKGCRTRALDALKRAAHIDPTDAVAHHELGYMYKDDGKRREAIAEFRRYLELRPDAGDVTAVQDDIYYLQEESRRAP